MDTNAVLSIAFSIVANFTNVVYVPPEAVPQRISDLESYQIGRPHFPMDIYLRHKRGTQFWIKEGVVKLYYAPDRYFGLQDPKLISKFVGPAKISSNEVFLLATSTVKRLVEDGDPLTNIPPVVRAAKPFHNQTIPSYDITWPRPENPKIFSIARVGVDARYGQIVSLALHGPGFDDHARLQQISNMVFRADTRKPAPPLETNAPVSPKAK